MLNRSASLAMSTSVLKAMPGKLDIKRHPPSILYVLCHAEYFYVHVQYHTPPKFLSYCSAVFQFYACIFNHSRKKVWILIRWLRKKPDDLDEQCFSQNNKPGFSRTEEKNKITALKDQNTIQHY